MAEPLPRILVLGNLPPHVLGGAENQISRLVERWLELGAAVEVAGHRIPNGTQWLGGRPLRTHRLSPWRTGGRPGRALGYLFSLWRLAWQRRRDFDVVYCRGLGDAALSLALGRTFGIVPWSMLVVPINAGGAGDAHFLRSLPAWRLWCRLLDRQIEAVNLINSDIASELDDLGLTRARRSFIPNGIPLLPAVSRSPGAEVRRLVWTGRLEHQKGLDLLFPALAECRQEGARFQLTLWGEGSRENELRSLASSLGIDDSVRFAGACPADAVRNVLCAADAFVLPSRYEGMSNSALEAMETSLPVLCTRCGGIDAAVEEGAGWVCEPNDASALRRALREMFSQSREEWLAQGRRARELVESRFAMNSVAQANLDLLGRVAKRVAR